MKLQRRTIIGAAIIGGTFMILGGIGIYGLIVGPNQPTNPATAEPSSRPTAAPPSAASDPILPITATDDPAVFAASVAHAIFDWDTVDNIDPDTIVANVLTVGDPTGFEQNGLVADLDAYLPTDAQWQVLRRYGTAQHLDIASAVIPASWPGIAADPANDIAPGTVAITIQATRTRTGGWGDDADATSEQFPVEFTMFLSCPVGGTCSVLRLSQLGAALH